MSPISSAFWSPKRGSSHISGFSSSRSSTEPPLKGVSLYVCRGLDFLAWLAGLDFLALLVPLALLVLLAPLASQAHEKAATCVLIRTFPIDSAIQIPSFPPYNHQFPRPVYPQPHFSRQKCRHSPCDFRSRRMEMVSIEKVSGQGRRLGGKLRFVLCVFFFFTRFCIESPMFSGVYRGNRHF